MRFVLLSSLALCALVHAGDGDATPPTIAPTTKAGKNAKVAKNAKGKAAAASSPTPGSSSIADRQFVIGGSASVSSSAPAYASPAVATVSAAALVVARPASCPYNNCKSCTAQIGCYWTGAGCSSAPCSVYEPCAIAPAQCGGCSADSQCGAAPRRCENGQCVGVEGDKACDFYLDCSGCLTRPNCLWDPNTVTGSCKPKEQCDFTYQQRELVLSPTPALPPATACVKTLDRCNAPNLNGVGLNLNLNRGVGCTNHGQCNPDQYCYSCSKCTGSCTSCKAPGVPVAGMCGPAWRCPIDRDSISQTCPIVGSPVILTPVIAPPPIVVSAPYVAPVVTVPAVVVRPVAVGAPANACSYLTCASCTAAYGCVWSGTSCYYTTVLCTNRGCANTPQQCPAPTVVVTTPAVVVKAAPSSGSSCAYNNCQNCAAQQGCAWSGQFCYYAYTPCTTYGCANTPAQCGGCTSDSQCGAGRRCDKGACLTSAGDRSCDYYTDCVGCLANANCLWDPNSFTHCKPKEQCDFTFRGLSLGATASAPPPATACVKTVDKCSQTDFNGAVLDPNQNRGAGCTNHGQCLNGQYCFSCSKCQGDCAPCHQGGAPVSGACGPLSQCAVDQDSINDLCPVG